MNGHRKFLEQCHADGLIYMFGNPGTSEEGLLDEVSRFPEISYVETLHEGAAICIADGYAQATQRMALVQLHAGVGLGNAMGGLYHAFRRGPPMLVIAGEAGIRYDAMNAQMAADLVAIARPVTKYATRVVHPESLLRLLRRCVKIAATPPTGPVFLAIPQDVLDAQNDEPVVPTVIPSTRVAADPALVEECARILCFAQNPIVLMGDGVARSGAQAELARLAELVGAAVWGVNSSEVNLPWTHPLFCGLTGHMFGPESQRRVQDADVVLICGTYVFPEVFPSLRSPFRSNAKIIHIDLDAFEIAKNHPITIGLLSDPKMTLSQLADAVSTMATGEQQRAVAARAEQISQANRAALESARMADDAQQNASPLRMSAFAKELVQHLSEEAIIFDEAITHSPELTHWFRPGKPGQYFQTPGGTLGVGLPGAIGVKLAHPDSTVIGFSGDGGCMYTHQALWTAAHHRIGAKFVVVNNHSYRILKLNIIQYWRDLGLSPNEFPSNFPPSFDLGDPNLDVVTIARGLGVEGTRVTERDEIAPAIDAMLKYDGPFLIDLVVDGSVPRPAA